MENSHKKSDSYTPIDSQFTQVTTRQTLREYLLLHPNLGSSMRKIDSVLEPAFGNLFHDVFLGFWSVALLPPKTMVLHPMLCWWNSGWDLNLPDSLLNCGQLSGGV